jgi:hypothetical protein
MNRNPSLSRSTKECKYLMIVAAPYSDYIKYFYFMKLFYIFILMQKRTANSTLKSRKTSNNDFNLVKANFD